MKVAVVIPTYNEKENISSLVPEIFRVFSKNRMEGRVIIVDDGSPDGTAQEAERLGKQYPITLVSRGKKMGIGSAYIAGFTEALKDSDVIFEMDADFSHAPRDIPAFVQKAQDHDIVVGSRYIPGGRIEGWDLYRKSTSHFGNLLAKLLLGIKVKDITTGYRAYRREALSSLDFKSIRSNGYSFQVEILYLMLRKGGSVCEVPIVFKNREIGKSKLSKKEIFWFFVTCFRLRMMGMAGGLT